MKVGGGGVAPLPSRGAVGDCQPPPLPPWRGFTSPFSTSGVWGGGLGVPRQWMRGSPRGEPPSIARVTAEAKGRPRCRRVSRWRCLKGRKSRIFPQL